LSHSGARRKRARSIVSTPIASSTTIQISSAHALNIHIFRLPLLSAFCTDKFGLSQDDSNLSIKQSNLGFSQLRLGVLKIGLSYCTGSITLSKA
jgi:hypothetical protein